MSRDYFSMNFDISRPSLRDRGGEIAAAACAHPVENAKTFTPMATTYDPSCSSRNHVYAISRILKVPRSRGAA
jgi:hypothetical protein